MIPYFFPPNDISTGTVHKHEILRNFLGLKSKPCMTLVNIRKKSKSFFHFLPQLWVFE